MAWITLTLKTKTRLPMGSTTADTIALSMEHHGFVDRHFGRHEGETANSWMMLAFKHVMTGKEETSLLLEHGHILDCLGVSR